jgi:phosphoribosylformylglycinamidine synthase
MAELCGGCRMDLAKAPLKYAGMKPWEILVSEAQERMSFAVQPENLDKFVTLAKSRDVEATVMGEFTNDGKFHMMYNEETVALMDIEFMHDGLPRLKLKAEWNKPSFSEADISKRDYFADLETMIGRLNICSDEYKARQYDHEVKGLSVIKPMVGVCRDVVSDATVNMIEQLSNEGVILSEGILPRYSDIDTYHMSACAIDTAIRNAIAAGAKMDYLALLDNFCWCSSTDSQKLGELKLAVKSCYDYSIAYGTPFISGKDSMFNDFKGYDKNGKKILISIIIGIIALLGIYYAVIYFVPYSEGYRSGELIKFSSMW